MRPILWALALAVIVAGAAYATRPGMADFDALLRAAIERRIATTDVTTDGDALSTIALVGCKLRPSDCFNLVRKSLDVSAEDRTFFTRFTVVEGERRASCTGAFTKIWCEKGVLEN
ncbi:hypothetical protein [Defluviimonas sp. SAOS-178_SWC]|uniref:hypothetical protein n=1 Tax=Defluviimonas sp. SAOS-178_SWC TaxID=3121287 RepID=UPI003221EC04